MCSQKVVNQFERYRTENLIPTRIKYLAVKIVKIFFYLVNFVSRKNDERKKVLHHLKQTTAAG